MTATPPPVPAGVPGWAWDKLARADGARWAIDERDSTGAVIGTAYRDAGGEKTFKPGGKRGLILAWPLAESAGVSADAPVYVAEGASDTAALLGLGFEAVGVPMAGQCAGELAKLLRGRHAVIVADADQAGRRGSAKIAAALAGRCASVRTIEPPESAKDARAAVIAGANAEAFAALAAQTTEATKEPAAESPGAPVVLCLARVEPREVRWLWRGRIPRGRISLLVGRPGEGKSFATADFAARVSTGRLWPDGAPCELGSVLLVSGEDDPADTIRPRLDAHGADVRRVHLLRGVQGIDSRGKPAELPFTLADLPPLCEAIARMDRPALVVIDPIGSFIGGRVDAHRDNEVRAVLAPMARLAEDSGAAFLLVAHQRKGAATHADDLVLGSRAFTGIARSVLHLLRDPDDDARRLLLPGKINVSAPAAGLAFKIGGTPARLEWELGEVELTAGEVLAAQAGGERTEKGRDDAADWLRDFLHDGPKPARDVLSEARAAGFSKRTIDRAKPTAGIRTRKQAGYGAGWVWELPSQERHPAAQDRQTGDTGNLGNLRLKPEENGDFPPPVPPNIATPEGLATFGGPGADLGGADTGDGWGEVA